MIFVYIILTYLIYLLIPFVYLFSKKGRDFLKLRMLDRLKLKNFNLEDNSDLIWLHSASVGELDQAKALANTLILKNPKMKIIQSYYSESIIEKNLSSHSSIINFRLPLDFYHSYNFIFEKFKPKFLVIMAWDTWPNLILSAKRHGCKVYLANATLNPDSGRNSFLIKNLYKHIFNLMDGISPVSDLFFPIFSEFLEDKNKLKVCGDSRFDSVVEKIQKRTPTEKFSEFISKFICNRNDGSPKSNILILASTYSQCDDLFFPILNNLIQAGMSIWIFPHKINPERILEIKNGLDKYSIPYSLFSNQNSPLENVIIIDELGILAFAYKHGMMAYVGGALHNRVHNVIEPACFGLPIFTGPKIKHSSEALTLNKLGGLFILNDSKEIESKIIELLNDKSLYQKIVDKNKQFVESNLGASERFYNAFLSTYNLENRERILPQMDTDKH